MLIWELAGQNGSCEPTPCAVSRQLRRVWQLCDGKGTVISIQKGKLFKTCEKQESPGQQKIRVFVILAGFGGVLLSACVSSFHSKLRCIGKQDPCSKLQSREFDIKLTFAKPPFCVALG